MVVGSGARSPAGSSTWSSPIFSATQYGGVGLGGGLGVGCPSPRTSSHGSVAFAEGGEMPFSQQSFYLTLV